MAQDELQAIAPSKHAVTAMEGHAFVSQHIPPDCDGAGRGFIYSHDMRSLLYVSVTSVENAQRSSALLS